MPHRDTLAQPDRDRSSVESAESSDAWYARLLASAATFERELWLVVVCGMLVDIAMTVHGLQIGLVERNPVARHALSVLGVFGLYVLKVVALALGGFCWYVIPNRYGPIVAVGLAIPTFAAICINSVVITIVYL